MITDFEKDIEARLSTIPKYETGFIENIGTSFGAERRDNLPTVSRWIADTDADQNGKKVLYDMQAEGRISGSVISAFTRMGKLDVGGALDYLERTGVDSSLKYADYIKERDEQYENDRSNDQEIFDRAGSGGAFGDILGRMGATFTDPLYLATLPIGIGSSTTILSAGLRTAALEMAIETAAIPFIWDFQKETGSTYGYEDAARHLGYAAAGGFVFGAGGKAITKALGKKFGKLHDDAVLANKGFGEGDVEGVSTVASDIQGAPVARDPGAEVTDVGYTDDVFYKQGEEIVGARMEEMEAQRAERKAADGETEPPPDGSQASDPDATPAIKALNELDEAEASIAAAVVEEVCS